MEPKPPVPFQDAAGPFGGSTDALVVAKVRRNLTMSPMQSSEQLACGIRVRLPVQLAATHLCMVVFSYEYQDGTDTAGEKCMHLQGDGQVFYLRSSCKGRWDMNEQVCVKGRD